MTSRTAALSAVVVALLLPAAAEATPRLAGVYTLSGSEFCQAIPGSPYGSVAMWLSKAVVTGTTFTMPDSKIRGSLFASAADFQYRTKNATATFALTGSGNPYTLTFINGSNRNSRPIQLQQIDANGVAHRAQTLETRTNEFGKVTCTVSYALQRH